MNEFRDSSTRGDDELLDLFVDGELDAAPRRKLIERLAAEPDGWRRCALAFLEAQTWRQTIRDESANVAPRATQAHNHVALEPAPAASTAASALETHGSGRQGRMTSLRSVLALAATFLAAFSLGFAARGAPQPIVLTRTVESPLDTVALTEFGGDKDTIANEGLESSKLLAQQFAESAPYRAAGFVELNFGAGDASQQLLFPVFEGPQAEELLARRPPVVPASLRKTFEDRGHQILERRELLNLETEDGRRLVMPVDEVEVRFAYRVYQ